MKKKKLILFIFLIGLTVIGMNFYQLNINNNDIEIQTYIDGKLTSNIPESTDGYKVSSITCTNGAIGTFNYSTWRLETTNVTSNTTCSLEFISNDNTTFAAYLKNKVCSSTPTSDSAAKDCLVNENGYRYEGSDPNNYVLFNNEIWRIIGVFNVTNSAGTNEDLVKLIKVNVLDGLAWDGNGDNDWSVATLQTQLNSGYLNATDISCNGYSTDIIKTCNFSKTGLNSVARSMVESVVWNLGGYSSYSITVDEMYSYERSTTVYSGNPTTWTGKVALMYTSDYGYGVLESSCARTTTLRYYYTTDCAGNNWLYKDGYRWLLTPYTNSGSRVFNLAGIGNITYNSAYWGYGVEPSLYLKSSIKYIDGTGTYSDPYVIS